jgi:hypothetical protein
MLTTAVLLAGCGCDDKPASQEIVTASPTASAADREYDLDETARTAGELLGGDGTAVYAVLKAFDSGYSPYQIARAIDDGVLDESGAVEGVTPAWPSGNTLSRADGARAVAASVALGGSFAAFVADTDDGSTSRSDFEQMFAGLREQGESGRWLIWVLGATGTGYSVGQITQYLDENKPFTELSPPSSFGVPYLVSGDEMVEPELPTDWPYKGRNILAGLQDKDEIDFDANLTVLVIGMVNAGYSQAQIWEALKGNGIGLCSTQGDSSRADTRFAPCYVEQGEIVRPAETTPWSPAEIIVKDITPDWRTDMGTSPSPNASSRLKSGEKVSLKLYPYIPGPDTNLKITSHAIVMEIAPNMDTTASVYDISGTWRVELIRTETDESVNRSYDKGDRYILEGEFYTEGHGSTSLDPLRAATSYTWAFRPASGSWRDAFEDRGESDSGFRGSLDEDLEGDGFFNAGPVSFNWDTFAGVVE